MMKILKHKTEDNMVMDNYLFFFFPPCFYFLRLLELNFWHVWIFWCLNLRRVLIKASVSHHQHLLIPERLIFLCLPHRLFLLCSPGVRWAMTGGTTGTLVRTGAPLGIKPTWHWPLLCLYWASCYWSLLSASSAWRRSIRNKVVTAASPWPTCTPQRDRNQRHWTLDRN